MSWFLIGVTALAACLFLWSGDGEPQRLEPELDENGLELPLRRLLRLGKLTGRDWLLMLCLTLLFAGAGFIGLGDRTGVESWHTFRAGEQAVLELSGPRQVSRIQYFSGATVGEFTFAWSPDGEHWEQERVKQDYVAVLKWHELEQEEPRTLRYLRITAHQADLTLGEVALRDGDGALLPLTGCEALWDEQALAPEKATFRNSSYFDEIYHVRTAWEHLTGRSPYEITHPPLGKLLLGLGIRLWGLNPFGWRFVGVLVGVLMLPMLYALLKLMLEDRRAAFWAAVVFGLDFMHFTQTRLATIDTYGAFFTLFMYFAFYLYLAQPWDAPLRVTMPLLGLSGLGFALGAASKWTCIFGGAGLAVLWLLRQALQLRWERRMGLLGNWRRWLPQTVGWSCVFFLLFPVLAYLLCYIPYGKAAGVSLRSTDYLRVILDNIRYMYTYHSGLDSTHPYQSPWWQWLLDLRPILYYLEYLAEDHSVRSAFGACGNPLFWWTGLGTMLLLAVKAVKGDGMSWFILAGYLSTLLPWVAVERCAFIYHYFPCTLFLALGVGRLMADQRRRYRRAWLGPVMGVSCGLLFALFYPALSGVPYGRGYGDAFLRWFGGMWPF